MPSYSRLYDGSMAPTEVRPVERRADLVLLLVDRAPVRGIIVEVQLSRDRNKQYVWPFYAASHYAKLKCPVHVVVVTPEKSVAKWTAQPINLGDCTFKPRIIGPENVPMIESDKQARANPELAVLSPITHARDPDVTKSVRIAATAIWACRGLDSERSGLYFDLIYCSLDEGARRALRRMLPANYQYQSDFARKYYGRGMAAGEAKGRNTLKSVIARQLTLRFGPLGRVIRSRLAAASVEELEAIAQRLVIAPTLENALGRKRRVR